MNRDSIHPDLDYLARLVASGAKRLGRWELPIGIDEKARLTSRGLDVVTVRRETPAGTISHTAFSRGMEARQYRDRFDGKPIGATIDDTVAEGVMLGYPECCAASFALNGYAENGVPESDQALLFHWACPGCKATPPIVESYRKCRPDNGDE